MRLPAVRCWATVVACVLLLPALSSCTYLVCRRNDLLDVVVLAVEEDAFGVVAKVGPWPVGLYYAAEGSYRPRGAGLIGGQLTEYSFEEGWWPPWPWIPWYYFQVFEGFHADARGKEYSAKTVFPLPVIRPGGGNKSAASLVPRYTAIEVALGLGVGVRAGVNPGEFLDLILGFFGMDLYSDDVVATPGLDRGPDAAASMRPGSSQTQR